MRNKRSLILLATCLITIVGALPIFAMGSSEGINGENALWYQAEEIVENSASVLPAEKTLVWSELSPSGDVISEDSVTFFYSEAEEEVLISELGEKGKYVDGYEIQVDIAGDYDTFVKRSLVNDGLLWTPFDDDVDAEDVTVANTGRVELVNGTECSVFDYTLYRDAAQYGYDFEETVRDSRDLIADYEDPESNSTIVVKGLAWIDGNGVLRQLVSNVDYDGVTYTETIKYEFDGSTLYPTASTIEGVIDRTVDDIIIESNFRAEETMFGYWTATDFYR
ncbi:MAG: hypothetical protein PQJ61_17140 [Spirochaetales bacterium]|uniref:Uncharacterized protein n=1 Tax=Candidatus Thalassospirochaeta sargassi TaxID=3119039 RepID=A0AAJ1IFS3_9SPIO|nr:hypothetical protein [Spirochaetales bacterium]